MAGLRPASEMKDSGIREVGNIPYDWKCARIARIIENSSEGIMVGPFGSSLTGAVVGENDGKYKVYGQANLIRRDFEYGDKFVDERKYHELSRYKVIPGDVAISMMGTVGKCRVIPEGIREGIMDSHLIKARLSGYVLPIFFEYIYESSAVYEQIMAKSTGTIMTGLNSAIVKSLFIAIPPLQEQQAIAAYLDERCSKIDELIAEAAAGIAEYKELKQAVIFEAVTKGLDKNVPLKDSGVPWIGSIPLSWNMTVLRRFCSFKTGKTPLTSVPEWFDGEVNWFTPGDFNETYCLENSQRKLSQKALDDSAAIKIDENCVMIVGIGGSAGKVGITKVPCSCNQQITAVMSTTMNSKYLMYYLELDGKYLKETAMFTTLPILNNDTLGNSPLIVPTIEEQERIADYLDSRLITINILIGEKQALIDDLKAYKKSLIYEVVTGKRRVV